MNPVLSRLLEEGIKPRAFEIGEIVARGQIAVLVFEFMGDPAVPRFLGWDGTSSVFALDRKIANRYARKLEQHFQDLVAANWLTRRNGPGRIFVMIHNGSTLLVNHEPQVGFWLEPGSTDAEAGRVSPDATPADPTPRNTDGDVVIESIPDLALTLMWAFERRKRRSINLMLEALAKGAKS